MDQIVINNLRINLIVGVDYWERPKLQQVLISLFIKRDFDKVATTDDIHDTMDYTKIQKQLITLKEFDSLESLADHLFELYNCKVKIELPKATLFSKSVSIERNGNNYIYVINSLNVEATVGVNSHERISLQPLFIHLELISSNSKVNYRMICREIRECASCTSFKTLEKLNIHLLRKTFQCHPFDNATIMIDKTTALQFTESARVVSSRSLKWFQTNAPVEIENNICYFSIGSNINPVQNINKALVLIESFSKILDTSFLYESEPMYNTNQSKFLNCVVKISCHLSPLDLLKSIKQIEIDLGRSDTGINGPRPIDIDIMYFNEVSFDSELLKIPHIGIKEREFVLRPMVDIAPLFVHPTICRNQKKLLDLLMQTQKSTCQRIIPINGTYMTLASTKIMGIVNRTPDSFSDGNNLSLIETVDNINRMVSNGADIIDIGGQSTRPGADDVGLEEECNRVLPLLEKLSITTPISIDTYRPKVAERAIQLGASMINDVTACKDPQMLHVIKKYKVPIVLMHMRGTPKTMSQQCDYNDKTLENVQKELTESVKIAINYGIPRWLIIVDPGLGFAKNVKQNIELIKLKSNLIDDIAFGSKNGVFCCQIFKTFPILMGPSRKGFIGEMSNEPIAKDRQFGTAAVVTVCIENGCDIIRVHDVKEMSQVARTADYIYKS